jgi:hypothetical protein
MTVRKTVRVDEDSQKNCLCGKQAAIFTKILSQDREKVFHQDGGAKPYKLMEF